MSLRQDFRDEFQRQKATFRDGNPVSFYKCRWWDVSIPLLVFRIAAAIYAFTVLVIQLKSSFDETVGSQIMCAFTIWSYIIVICYFLVASLASILHTYYDHKVSTHYNFNDGRDAMASNENHGVGIAEGIHNSNEEIVIRSRTTGLVAQLPWYMKIQWCLYNVALPSSILVTLVYWGVLYPMIRNKPNLFFDISVHALNSVFMITEQYLGFIPTRLVHVYQPIIYGIIYIIFSAIVWSQTGLVLYPYVLDWGNPITAASLFGILLYYFVTQLVLYLIYRAQNVCHSKRNI